MWRLSHKNGISLFLLLLSRTCWNLMGYCNKLGVPLKMFVGPQSYWVRSCLHSDTPHIKVTYFTILCIRSNHYTEVTWAQWSLLSVKSIWDRRRTLQKGLHEPVCLSADLENAGCSHLTASKQFYAWIGDCLETPSTLPWVWWEKVGYIPRKKSGRIQCS